MATKFRKDISAEDFQIATRFKSHLLSLIKTGKIVQSELIAPIGYHQEWYKTSKWKPNRIVQRTDIPCYCLTIREFRGLIGLVAADIPSVTEGLVIETFKKMSLFLLDKDGAWNWSRGGLNTTVLLERGRFSPGITFRPRNPNTACARLDSIRQVVYQVMDDNECSYETAYSIALLNGLLGVTAEEIHALERQTEEAKMKKLTRSAEIDELIRKRFTKQR